MFRKLNTPTVLVCDFDAKILPGEFKGEILQTFSLPQNRIGMYCRTSAAHPLEFVVWDYKKNAVVLTTQAEINTTNVEISVNDKGWMYSNLSNSYLFDMETQKHTPIRFTYEQHLNLINTGKKTRLELDDGCFITVMFGGKLMLIKQRKPQIEILAQGKHPIDGPLIKFLKIPFTNRFITVYENNPSCIFVWDKRMQPVKCDFPHEVRFMFVSDANEIMVLTGTGQLMQLSFSPIMTPDEKKQADERLHYKNAIAGALTLFSDPLHDMVVDYVHSLKLR